ncbi:MAG: cyclopropane-fatty-acyl-phospholipid synthase family protein [Burkholderiales bacterium]
MKPFEADLVRNAVPMPRTSRLLLSLFSRLRYGSLRFSTPEGVAFAFQGDLPGPPACFDVLSWQACREIVRRGDLGFAEGYIDRLWETDDLVNLITLAALNRDAVEKAIYGRWWGQILYRLRHFLRTNTRTGSRRNIAAHYDLGNDFYRLWLDETMAYSSGLFETEPSRALVAAQTAKYERVLERLDVRPGDRILEIGSGWGGFAAHAAASRGCRVHGITLSVEQLRWARAHAEHAGLADRVSFELLDYRDTAGSYDHVVSLEMYEAVGERYWPAYFGTIRNRLKPGGKALVQAITIDDELFDRYRRGTDFIQQYVFPGGMLASPQVLRREIERAGLRVGNVFGFGADYAETLRRWRVRFNKAIPEVHTLGFDERFVRLWNFYLAYCEAGFRARSTDVFHVEIERV